MSAAGVIKRNAKKPSLRERAVNYIEKRGGSVDAGVTMVEVLVVMVVAAILASVVFLVFNSMSSSARETNGANLATGIQQAYLDYYGQYGKVPSESDLDTSLTNRGDSPVGTALAGVAADAKAEVFLGSRSSDVTVVIASADFDDYIVAVSNGSVVRVPVDSVADSGAAANAARGERGLGTLPNTTVDLTWPTTTTTP